ncbi:hypothetical protein MMC14_000901 [Varicellaria rhodocarpa]|nr:hypothetical protein [Varicellaria rhodocarpa]
MADPLDIFTWPWYPLAAVTPVPPDFILCDQYYGLVGTSFQTLDLSDCVQAAGGFGTVQFQNVVNWVTTPSTTFENISQEPWPYDATFFTVTIMSDIRFEGPGYEDPAISEALSDAMQKAGRNAPANSDMAAHYSEGTSRLFQQAQRMTPRGSPGSPNPADCSMLKYTQLGPPTDAMTVRPGLSRFFSSKTCNLAVTTGIAVVITWAQIRAALGILIDVWVSHSLSSARSGERMLHSSHLYMASADGI